MVPNAVIGKIGEKIAEKKLISLNYSICAKNWRSGHTELDMVAFHQGILVFVEVKTKRNLKFGDAYEAVNFKKQQNIGKAARSYMVKHNYFGELRFDIVSIHLDNNLKPIHIDVIQDAFWFQ